jgi:hypothetical protein
MKKSAKIKPKRFLVQVTYEIMDEEIILAKTAKAALKKFYRQYDIDGYIKDESVRKAKRYE